MRVHFSIRSDVGVPEAALSDDCPVLDDYNNGARDVCGS
jgi:hypothetical protein